MPDEDPTKAEEKASEEVFSPDALSPEAKEYIRKTVQSESDRKAALQTQAELRKFQAAQAATLRKTSEQADQTELTRLASEQNYEEIGRRVAGRLSTQGIKEAAILETAEVIERQLVEQFSKTLGIEAVEEPERDARRYLRLARRRAASYRRPGVVPDRVEYLHLLLPGVDPQDLTAETYRILLVFQKEGFFLLCAERLS